MTKHDRQVAKKIVRDFRGARSLGLGALKCAAGLLGADDQKIVVDVAQKALEALGVAVRGPGLHYS